MQQLDNWQSRALTRIFQVWSAVCLVLLVIGNVFAYSTIVVNLTFVSMLLACGISLLLVRRGQRRFAIYFLAAMFYIGLSIAMVFRGGLETPAAMYLVLPVILLGLMGSPRDGIVAFCLSVFIFVTFFVLFRQDIVARPSIDFVPAAWLVGLIGLSSITLALSYFSSRANDHSTKTISHQVAQLRQQRDSLHQQLSTIQQSEQRFRFLLENAGDAIFIYDIDGNIIDASEKACASLGYTYAEVRQMNISRLLTDAELNTVRDQMLIQSSEVSSVIRHDFHRRRSGETFPVESRVSVAKIDGKHVFINMSRDISQRIETERLLNQAQRMQSLGVLAGGVAHDFNNLLVAMLGQSSLALRLTPVESRSRQPIQKTIDAAEKAAALTRQMLAFSGRGHFEMQQLDLNKLVQENYDLLRVSIPQGVNFISKLDDDVPFIVGDTSQVQQVVMNLIINAGEAVDPVAGMIRVNTRRQYITTEDIRYQPFTTTPLEPGEYAVLEVSDNGIGMSEETIEKIFDPFFTTKKTGNGLGLAALLGIIRGHKGGLTVYSELGQGTVFKVVLPATSVGSVSPQTTTANLNTAELKGQGLVLVIDDEELARITAADILTETGYDVVMAEDGRSGLEKLFDYQDEIGLILLDLNLPDMKAGDILNRIRRLSETVPVVLVSGYNYSEAMASLLGRSYVAFLQKPYTALELQSVTKLHIRLPG